MLAELNVLRKLRPAVRAPASHAVARAREALSAEMAAENRAPERRGGRWAARRWLVPSIVVVVLGAGGLATAGLGDWWLGGEPPDRPDQVAAALDFGPSPRGASTSRIEPQFELARTVARAPGAALVAVPAENDEGFCIVRVPDGKEADGNCLGGDWAEFYTDWIHDTGSSRAWYLLGRVRDPGAARLVLFEEVTHPFDEREPGTTNAEPQVVDVGPGGFYLARVPEPSWSELDLAYGSMSVLDEGGAQIRRICRYVGLSPASPLAVGGGGYGSGPVETADPDNMVLELERCPATGSAVRAATLAPVSPRRLDLTTLAGRDVISGERFSLSSLVGKPVILAVFQEFLFDTTTRRLLELDRFAGRHPEAQLVVLVYHGASAPGVERLALEFPVVRTESPLLRDAFGDFKPFVLALDAAGEVTGELAVRSPYLGVSHALLTQQALEGLLVTATSG